MALAVAKERQRELWAEAERAQLLRSIELPGRGLMDRLLLKIADLLVSSGEKLRALSVAYSSYAE
jgi:hypothetical protein